MEIVLDTQVMLCFLCGVIICSAFSPTVSLTSCTRSLLVVKVTEASDGGLIYIQGQNDNCKQTTSSSKEFYEFNFTSCNIEWQLRFRLIVQKSAMVQTGADKQVPLLCVADTNDVVVGNFIQTGDKENDAGLNRTVKPQAKMTFFKAVSEEQVSGREVKLSDSILMILELKDEYKDEFDIKARFCIASGIVLVNSFCAREPELFGNFLKTRRGVLFNQFGAFRATDLSSTMVTMNFTCILKVCLGTCLPEKCDEVYTGYGRRRRSNTQGLSSHVKHKRQVDEDSYGTLNVGASMVVVETYSEIKLPDNDRLCWSLETIVIVITSFSVVCISSTSGCLFFQQKWRKLRQKNSINTTMATKGRGRWFPFEGLPWARSC